MPRRKVRIVFGPPGTGKTHYLIETVASLLRRGIDPSRVAFVSFSRRAVREAAERAVRDIPSLKADDLEHFRTIHSTAFKLLDLDRGDVLQDHHMKRFGQMVGMEFRGAVDENQPNWEGTLGDRAMALYSLARSRGTSLEEEHRRAMIVGLPLWGIRDLVANYERFKAQNALVDFHDMIEQAGEYSLDVDVLIVDEAQDCSTAQWKLLRAIARDVPEVYLAGDDDQSIYGWSGADTDLLTRLHGERHVLPQSYRLPRRVKALADRIVGGIHNRVPKDYAPRDEDGLVEWITELDQADLSSGEWLLLARSNYQLGALRNFARSAGVVYSMADGTWSWNLPAVKAATVYERLRAGGQATRAEAKTLLSFTEVRPAGELDDHVSWGSLFDPTFNRELHWYDALPLISDRDAEYIRALRRRGESLTKPGRVRIGTVHSVKGAQADHVLLVTDVSEKVKRAARVDPDSECRVQYVAVTRARQSLHLLQPRSRTFWNFGV